MSDNGGSEDKSKVDPAQEQEGNTSTGGKVEEELLKSPDGSNSEEACSSNAVTDRDEGEEKTGRSSEAEGFPIKRINSSKRNYRSSLMVDSSEDSNSQDQFCLANSNRKECEDADGKVNEGAGSSSEQNEKGSTVTEGKRQEANGEDANNPDGNNVLSAGQDNDNDDDVLQLMSDTESSDNSSLHFMNDDEEMEEDSSSDSSDCILEDLEDPITVRGKTERDFNENSNDSTTAKAKPNPKENSKKIQPQELPDVLKKPKPKHCWSGPRELLTRELGYRGKVQHQTAEVFRSRFYGSLFSAERLELMQKLDGHSGCVNCLNFNYAGTKLASGSDDLTIKLWNYGLGKLLTSFQSGHRANVFQAKFLPLVGIDNMIVSCARDNQVRLNQLDTTGKVASSRKLAQHKGAAHKLSVHPENPQVVLSCGEDSVVYSIDIREDKPQKLLNVREKNRKVLLYSIHSNPLASYEFCVTGTDQYVRVYDARKLSMSSVSTSSNDSADSSPEDNSSSVRRFCPQHLIDSRSKSHVTAAVYSYNGKEILGSYNDENIYLFDATHSDMADCVKVYEGHRNSATDSFFVVKGVNFFGDRSQFVISGSDCGHIFIWDKETESIVNFFRGDENGVVNCLEPHPSAPILATSGLDDDIKIWIPSNEKPPKMGDLAQTVRRNLKKRTEELDDQATDGHLMFALLSHMRRAERRRRREAGELSDSSSDDDNDNEEDENGLDSEFHYRSNECCIT